MNYLLNKQFFFYNLNQNYSSFNNYYTKEKSLRTGSSLSSITVEVFIQNMDDKVINNIKHK